MRSKNPQTGYKIRKSHTKVIADHHIKILTKSAMCQLYLLSQPIRIFNIFIAKTGGPVYCLFEVTYSV